MDKIHLPSEPPAEPDEVAEPTEKPVKKSTYKGYTPEQAGYNRKWEKSQARVNLRIRPELKTEIDAHAAARGESTMGFIIRAIKSQIERDKEGQQ